MNIFFTFQTSTNATIPYTIVLATDCVATQVVLIRASVLMDLWEVDLIAMVNYDVAPKELFQLILACIYILLNEVSLAIFFKCLVLKT